MMIRINYFKYLIFIYPVIIIGLNCPPLNAQINIQKKTNSAKLQTLSDKFSREFYRDYYHAVEKSRQNSWPVRQDMPDGSAMEIRNLDQKGMPIYVVTQNINAAQSVSTSRTWPGGLTGYDLDGSGMIVGIWDAGAIRASHQEFTGRVIQSDGATAINGHSTHVSGTMIANGVDPNAKGMAFQANLKAYDWSNDNAEMAAAAADGLLFSNHSYGLSVGWFNYYGHWFWMGDVSLSAEEDYNFGFYTNASQAWDEIAYNAPYYLIVRAAGNERGSGPAPGTAHYYWNFDGNVGNWAYSTDSRQKDGGNDGYDCLDAESVPKNILTVGSVNDIPGGYSSPGQVVIASSSSWGPTDDGRIKPDIVANGIGLYSTSSGSDVAYATMSGTSMAAPNATGSLVLLQQLYESLHSGNPMRASTLKGLVIHTADEAGTYLGPDYRFGWGLLNTAEAAELITAETNGRNSSHIEELSLENNTDYSVQVNSNGTEPLKVTISWTDPASALPPAALNSRLKMLVNDLDLRVNDQTAVYFPWTLNPDSPGSSAVPGDNITDNVEQVYIQNPIAGSYTITVNHKDTLTGGLQDFALIVSGGSYPGSVTVTSPNGGENWIAGTQHTINWHSSNFIDSVKIEFSADHGKNWTAIGSALENTGNYNWLVEGKSSNHYQIRISDAADGLSFDQSDGDFSISQLNSITNLSIEKLSDRLYLHWPAIEGASGYKIYRDSNPMFDPAESNLLVTTSDRFYYDIDNDISNNIIGDTDINYFYVVRSMNTLAESENSNRVGEYDFNLLTSSNGSVNEIAICLWDNSLNRASDLLKIIPNSSSVAYWNTTIQKYVNYQPANPKTNFQIEAGNAYQLEVSENTIFTITGELVDVAFSLFTTPGTDFNSIILPLTISDIDDAKHLLNSIPNCNSIAYWDAAKQRFFQYIPVLPQTNFPVKPGTSYHVNVSLDSNWP